MKHIFLSGLVLMAAMTVSAQKAPVKKIMAPTTVLKDHNDSLSYALGINVAEGLKQQNIPSFNTSLMQKGMEAAFFNKAALISGIQGNEVAQRCISLLQEKKPLPVVKNPLAAKSILKTTYDSASYAIGFNIASNMKQQQLEITSPALLCKAMDATSKNKPTLFTSATSQQIVQKHMQSLYERLQGAASAKINEEKAKGAAFLEANKKRPGVITTASGLQYEILKRGDSTSPSVKLTDRFIAHYAGTLIDGTEFDNSFKRGTPLVLGVTQVIPGWTEALQLMHFGDRYKIYMSSDLGYGDSGSGPKITGGAALIFEMELLGIEK